MSINRIFSKLIIVVFAVVLAVVCLQALPNAIAAFIYGTHQICMTKKYLSDVQP